MIIKPCLAQPHDLPGGTQASVRRESAVGGLQLGLGDGALVLFFSHLFCLMAFKQRVSLLNKKKIVF